MPGADINSGRQQPDVPWAGQDRAKTGPQHLAVANGADRVFVEVTGQILGDQPTLRVGLVAGVELCGRGGSRPGSTLPRERVRSCVGVVSVTPHSSVNQAEMVVSRWRYNR